ncbi:MAG: hypothetical protein MUP85_22200 [Candidatus Lokiarchaeota archaeon]|nr:hypothetical protein [Candidatus Lokiarchaeota archaeon]
MIKLVGHKSTKKQSLFKVFIYGMIEVICFNLYIIISGLEGNFNWTMERLTSSVAGMAIQTINLVAISVAFVLVIQLIIYVLLIFTGSD